MWEERGRRGGNRLGLALATAACALAVIVAAANAQDATEKTTFGKDGVATFSLGVHFQETQFSSVEARLDGGLVAQRGNQLESYLANGAPDPAVPPHQVRPVRKVFPLGGGKSLVVVARSLTRVNPDGSVDPSFGGTGTIKVPVYVQAAAELASGKILVAATNTSGTHETITSFTAALVNSDGSIDQNFDTKDHLPEPRPPIGDVTAIVPTSEDGALVVGHSFLLKLREDGTPNPEFGSGGVVSGLPRLVGGRILPDGSVEAVGSGDGPSGEDLVVLRYTAAGSPDLGFAPNGLRFFDLGAEELAEDVLWAGDGSAVVGGSSAAPGYCGENEGCEETPILAAFDPGGGLDPGFGDGGVLKLTGLGGGPRDFFRAGVLALTRRPDGSIVAAGGAAPRRTIAFFAAFSPEGALLPGFGDGGIVRVRRPVSANQSLSGLARLASGKLLAAGTIDVGIDDTCVLIRYNANGSLDRSFGAGAGYVTVGSSNLTGGFAVNTSRQVLLGVYGYPHSEMQLRTAGGAPVQSFGSDGAIQLPSRVQVEALRFGDDGGAIVVGSHNVAGDAEPGVVLRFLPSGEPDSKFGRNGKVPLRPGGKEMRARALGAWTGGRVLVGGIAGRRFAMVRLLPDGRPDPRFGSGGWSLPSAGGIAKSLTLSRIGSHIYLAGVASSAAGLRVILLRFDEDGHLDHTFGRHGRRIASISESAQPKAIVPSRSGVLVVLNQGARPLLLFSRDGAVRRHWVGSGPQAVENVRAIRSGRRLILSWSAFSRTIRRDTYHLAKRPLP